jgi:hypothetical protein
MHSSVGLNDMSCEDVQRYSAENHAIGIRRCSAGKESRDTSLKISQYDTSVRPCVPYLQVLRTKFT